MQTLPHVAVALAIALAFEGCAGSFLPSHIHDAERAALTAKLVTTLDAYDQSAPSVYETLLKSSRAIAAEQDKVLAELGNNRTAAREQLLPFKTLAALNREAQTVRDRLTKVQDAIAAAVNAQLKAQKLAAGDAKTAAQAIQEANKAVDDAKAEVTRWNASVALLQAAVSRLPALASAPADDSTQAGLEELARAVGNTEVSFTDADGATTKRAVKDILADQIKSAMSDRDFKIPDAPGATLTILALGVDLAKIQKQRADARLVQISRRLALYERVLAEAVLADALLNAPGTTARLMTFASSRGDPPLEHEVARLAYTARMKRRDVETALKGDQDEAITRALQGSDLAMLGLAQNLLLVRKLAVADSISARAELTLARDSARLAHEESLLDAQVNDQEWRAVLRSGLAVLNQYEQGGFTREDAANIIRIAQTLALGVIAGRLD
jgi:hypothetical protein